jgi:hypothetical protein
LQQQEEQIAELIDVVTQLQRRSTQSSEPPEKVTGPEKYGGDRKKLRPFLTGMDLFYSKKRRQYATDISRVEKVYEFLKDDAAAWMQPLVEDYLAKKGNDEDLEECKEETKELFGSWTGFKEKMTTMFGEINGEQQASRKLSRVRQTSSVRQYTALFKQLQAQVDWDDAPLRETFYNGLKESMKDELTHYPEDQQEDLEELINLTIRIDDRLQARRLAKGQEPRFMGKTRVGSPQVRYDKEGDVIMRTQGIQEGGRDTQQKSRKDQRQKKKPLTPEQKKRFQDGACIKCGEKGHYARECSRKETRAIRDATHTNVVRIAAVRIPRIELPDQESEESSEDDYPEQLAQCPNESWEVCYSGCPTHRSGWEAYHNTPITEKAEGEPCSGRPCRTHDTCRKKHAEEYPHGHWHPTPEDEEATQVTCEETEWFECDPDCTEHAEDWRKHHLLEWRRCPFACQGHSNQRRLEIAGYEPMIGNIDHPKHLDTRRQYCAWDCQGRHFDDEEPQVYKPRDGVIPEPDPEVTEAEDQQVDELTEELLQFAPGIDQRVPEIPQLRGRAPTPHPRERVHEELCWVECTLYTCEFHQQMKEATKALPARAEHALIPADECPIEECWVHRWDQWRKTHLQRGWAQCYDDDCERHSNEKHLAGYWPAGPRLGDLETCDEEDCTDPHPSQMHALVRWQDCRGLCPYHRMWKKAAARNHQDPGHKDLTPGSCLDDKRCQLHDEGHQTSKN